MHTYLSAADFFSGKKKFYAGRNKTVDIGRAIPFHTQQLMCVCIYVFFFVDFFPFAGRSKAVDMGRSAAVPHAAAQGVSGATQFTCFTGTKVQILT